MRTTVALDESRDREVVTMFHVNTETAAVALAVKEQICRAKLKKLASMHR